MHAPFQRIELCEQILYLEHCDLKPLEAFVKDKALLDSSAAEAVAYYLLFAAQNLIQEKMPHSRLSPSTLLVASDGLLKLQLDLSSDTALPTECQLYHCPEDYSLLNVTSELRL